MATKKKVSLFDRFYDLLVKLNNVFKDVYIIDRKYCLSGKESDEEALGDILCILNEKYEQTLEKMGIPDAVYITDIRSLKSDTKNEPDDYDVLKEKINELIKKGKLSESQIENVCYMMEADASLEDIYLSLNIPDDSGEIREYLTHSKRIDTIYQYVLPIEEEEILTACREKISLFTEEFQKPLIWENMGLNCDLIKSIYQDKRIFNMPIPKKDNGESYITIAKQLFPIVTEKTIDGAFMNLREDETYEDLYILLIDFMFTHFRFQAIYHSVPTKIIEERG